MYASQSRNPLPKGRGGSQLVYGAIAIVAFVGSIVFNKNMNKEAQVHNRYALSVDDKVLAIKKDGHKLHPTQKDCMEAGFDYNQTSAIIMN